MMNRDAVPITNDMREIVERIQQYVSHPYVQQYVDIPPIAENRLALLCFFLGESGLEKERVHLLCATTGLVQLGLDVHEKVKLHYGASIVEERNRQLSVLAGDYYSGHYYYLLSQSGDLQAIRILAQAIQEINEAKMKLYMLEQQKKLSYEVYVSLRKTIDGALYIGFVNAFALSEEERRFWTSLIEQTSAVEGMIGEWEQLQWEQIPFGFARYLLEKPDFTLAKVIDFVEAKALELIGVCEQLVRSFYPSEKNNPLAWVTTRYSHRVNRLKRVIEEL